jgi:CubicO group peptidase (beta-lactamase class C family)
MAATLGLALAACSPGGGAEQDGGTNPDCPAEEALRSALVQVVSDVDFSFVVERTSDGRRFVYERAPSTLQTAYESASTSKLVTAVIVLRVVDEGLLSLDDRPIEFIPDWPIVAPDPLADLTLAQLLSFTSGLVDEPLCLNLAAFDFATCVNNIGMRNLGNGKTPGGEFFYASTHLQVAGLMAMRAKNVGSFTALVDDFKADTGLFASGVYDLPSATNPRLAGGMHWTGDEYAAFLKKLAAGELLQPATQTALLGDHTASATIGYSPAFAALNEQWHYGFGLWHECASPTFNCTAGARVSSPGAYGAYPFWDRERGYFGLLARQGDLGSFTQGVAVERTVRPQVEAWLACP